MRYEESPDIVYNETAHLYDHLPRYSRRMDRDFYVAEARACGGRVLELGCGTGRVLLPIARAGVSITGLDLARAMLRVLEEKLAREPSEVRGRVRLVLGRMEEFDLGEEFALITTPFRSFQHLLGVDVQLACLERVRRHLAPAGRFILDVFNVDREVLCRAPDKEEVEDVPEVEVPDGSRLRRTSRVAGLHHTEQYMDLEMFYYVTAPDGRTRRYVQAFKWRYFFRFELEHLLARSGFRVEAVYGNYDRSPLRDDSPEMIFIAAKA